MTNNAGSSADTIQSDSPDETQALRARVAELEKSIDVEQSNSRILAQRLTDAQALEQTFRLAQEQLEQRVAQRTRELQQLAERLQLEINGREQKQSQLQASQAQLSAIMEHAPDIICQIDLNYRITFINRVAPGYVKEQLIGVDALDFSPEDSRPLIRAKFDRLFATGEPQSYENEVMTPHGTARWYEIRMGPILVDNRVVGATMIATEATERRRIEQTLERERRTLESILANMPLGVFVREVPGARPVVWNQRLFEITGRAAPYDFVDTTQLSEHYRAFKRGTSNLYPVDELPIVRAMLGQSSRVDDMVVQRPDGSWAELEVIGAPILDEHGQVAFGMILVQDISERNQAEAALQAEQQFLRALISSHEKDRQLMAYEIHDGLVQYIASALMHLESIEPDRLPGEFAQSSLSHATSLLRKSIADARRMLSGLRPPILDEQGIVEAIKYLIAETKAGGTIEIEFLADLQAARFEPLLEGTLFRIVQESLSNIRKHSYATRAQIELRQRGDRVELIVQDDGVGFDPATVPVHSLGLQGITRRAALMLGQAGIESQLGAGTTIRVQMPCLPAE